MSLLEDPVFLEKGYVWRYLTRHPITLRRIKEHLDLVNYFGDTPSFAALWQATKQIADTGSTFPEFLPIRLQLAEEANSNRDFREAFLPALEVMYEQVPDESYCKSILTSVIRDGYVSHLQQSLPYSDEPAELVKKVNTILSQDLFADVRPVKLGDFDREVLLSSLTRKRSGVEFLDYLFGGGFQAGEMALLLAPSGGGKSTTAMQLYTRAILNGERAIYLSGEQSIYGDMACRILVGLTGLSRKIVSDVRRHTPEQEEQIEKAIAMHDRLGCFIDATTPTYGSIRDMLEPAYEKVGKGESIGYICVDWWGRVLNNLMSRSAFRNDKAETRAKDDWLMELKRATYPVDQGGLGANILVMHQLAGAAADRGSDHIATSHAAQGDKNLNNMFDLAFVASRKSDDNIVKWKADKVRAGANEQVSTRLNGEFARFELMTLEDQAATAPVRSMSPKKKNNLEGYL